MRIPPVPLVADLLETVGLSMSLNEAAHLIAFGDPDVVLDEPSTAANKRQVAFGRRNLLRCLEGMIITATGKLPGAAGNHDIPHDLIGDAGVNWEMSSIKTAAGEYFDVRVFQADVEVLIQAMAEAQRRRACDEVPHQAPPYSTRVLNILDLIRAEIASLCANDPCHKLPAWS